MLKLDKKQQSKEPQMPANVKSSQVQQKLGLVMERALMGEDVIVERYGMPRVAIVV